MPRQRDHIPLATLLASELLRRTDADGKPWIPYEHAKLMTADQIISLFARHHNLYHVDGGPDTHWNVGLMPLIEHRRRTAEIDVPAIAKQKDVRTTQAVHRAAMASKAGDYAGAAQILAAAPRPPRVKARIPRRFKGLAPRCAACNRLYIFPADRTVDTPEKMIEWLNAAGWIVTDGEPRKFFCDEGCQANAAIDVTPQPQRAIGRSTP